METVTFRPKLFSPRRILLFVLLAVIATVTFIALKDNELTVAPFTTFFICIGAFFAQLSAWKTNVISIDDRFFHYRYGSLFMKPVQGTIHLPDVDRIGYAFGQKIVSSMTKGPARKARNSFVFYLTDGKKEPVPLYGWDDETLREMILYMKGKYPKIKYHTHVYRDSEEKLVGLLDNT